MYQEAALQISLVLIAALVSAYALVGVRSLKREEDYTPLQKRAYRIRALLFWALLVVVTPVMLYTLVDLPYAATHGQAREDAAQVVEAVGYQWYWTLSTDQIPLGKPVEFRVTSADVNHGFGIYDQNMQIVAQTMAMPGYTNKLRHTFTQPGTYKVLCLEYCGLVHHNMIAEFKVGG